MTGVGVRRRRVGTALGLSRLSTRRVSRRYARLASARAARRLIMSSVQAATAPTMATAIVIMKTCW